MVVSLAKAQRDDTDATQVSHILHTSRESIDPFRAGSIVACIPTPIQPMRTFPSDLNTEIGRSDTCTLLALQEPLSVAALWENRSISPYPFFVFQKHATVD